MPLRRVASAILAFCLISLGLFSCAVTRRIHRAGKNPAQPLVIADKATLIAIVARNFNSIRDFNATVDMTPSLGSAEKNKITEYKDVTAHILFRRPADIRILGLYPYVSGTAFDMVSNGSDFKLSIPAQNRFLVGSNEIVQRSEHKLENLRPQHFLEALLVRPIADASRVTMQNQTDEDDAFYILSEVEEDGDGGLAIRRAIWFSRLDLSVARQEIFDDDGNILSDARYADWHYFDSAPFPKHIEVNRPQDEYGVVIDVTKMDINRGVTSDKFVLNQPEGYTLQVIGQAPGPAPPAPPSPSRRRNRPQ
jgi:outer membrane lipoprotein-sorting protein